MTNFFSFLLIFVLSGCTVFNIFQGSFGQEDWEIEKIVLEDKEMLALRKMRELALQKLQDENMQEMSESSSQEYDEDENSQQNLQDLQELAQTKENSTFRFDTKQNKIFGMAGCNNFSADYAWKDADNIEIYEVNITRKLCSPSSLMDFEIAFTRKLKGIFFVEKKGKDLMILKNKEMQIYLKSK